MNPLFRFPFYVVVLMAALSTAAVAQGPPEGRPGWGFGGGRGMMRDGDMGPHLMEWCRRLNLSEDQIAKIQELREAYLKDTLESRNEVMVKRFQQRDLLRDPQSNPNEIMAMQRDISNLESRIQERALVFQLEVRKILTPAQVQLLPPGGGMGFGGMGMGRGRGMGRGF